MLGKLFKHEFIDLFKKTVIFFSVVIGLSLLIFLFGKLSEEYIIFQFINSLFIFGYFLSIAGIMLYAIFYPVTRYYKSMLKDEGYLTHTLPVTKWQLLFVKLVSAFVLFLVSIIVFAISFYILIGTLVPIEEFKFIFNSLIQEINKNKFVAYLIIFIYLIVYYFGSIMMFITALTVGHSRSQKKGLNSFFVGLIIYGIQQVLGTIAVSIWFISQGNIFENMESGEFNPFSITLISMIIYFVLTTAEIFTTHHFLKNKLNLE